MSDSLKRYEAISIASQSMTDQGYKHGPCLDCHPIGNHESIYWEVEFAHDYTTTRSETADPPSIVLQVNLQTKVVKSIWDW